MLQTQYGPQTPSLMAAPPQLKRTYPFPEGPSYPGAREIRPKPSSGGSAFGPMSPIEHPPKKKRGRPTKAEAQAKAEAEGQTIGFEPVVTPRLEHVGPSILAPPIVGSVVTPAVGTPQSIQPSAEEVRSTLPAVSRMPISSIITPTAPQSTSQSSSSSGKRRRGRSTRSEPENFPTSEVGVASQSQEYESTYGRAAAESQDTPARTAVLRHREEAEHGSQLQPRRTQEPSAQALPTTQPHAERK